MAERSARATFVVVAAVVAAVMLAIPATATSRVAFSRSGDIFTVEPDGSSADASPAGRRPSTCRRGRRTTGASPSSRGTDGSCRRCRRLRATRALPPAPSVRGHHRTRLVTRRFPSRVRDRAEEEPRSPLRCEGLRADPVDVGRRVVDARRDQRRAAYHRHLVEPRRSVARDRVRAPEHDAAVRRRPAPGARARPPRRFPPAQDRPGPGDRPRLAARRSRGIAYRDWRRTCHACGEIWVVRPYGSRNHVLTPVPASEGRPLASPELRERRSGSSRSATVSSCSIATARSVA